MQLPPLFHQVKLVVATHGTVLAAALVVVGLVAFAGAAWTVTHPPTIEVTEPVATHTVGTDVQTSTVVTGNTSLWASGTTLEDKPIYPLKSAPRLTVTMTTNVPPGQELRVSQELTLVYQATKDGTVFWETSRILVSEDRTVSDGQATASASIDVRQVRQHLDEINAEITGIGQAEAYLRLNVSYRSEAFSGSLSKTAPLTVLSTGYWVGGSLDAENTHQTPVTREVTQPPDTTTAIGLGLLGLVSMGGAGGIVFVAGGRLDPDAIADEIDRQRYREWVSTGRLGQFVSGQDVAMDSLQDLVDVAIDSNHRVVHDRQRDLYAVVDDSVIYYYDPYHPEPEIEFEPEVEVPLQYDGGHLSSFERGPDDDTVAPRERPADDAGRKADAPPATGDAGAVSGPTELPTEAVAVARTVGFEEGRLIVTYELSTDESEYVEVDVADRLPAECDDVASLRPLEGAEPADEFGIEGGVGFRALASSNGPRVVKFVARTDEPATSDTLEAIRAAPGPRVRRAVSMPGPEDR